MVLALLLALAQAPTPTREERVLELVRALQREGSWHYSRAFFETAPPPIGRRSIVAATASDVFCGNSDEGCIDGARVRRLALELASIYGLAMERERPVADRDGFAVLDDLDPAAKIGFELRGREDLDMREPLAEEGHLPLDERELARLERQGWRVFVADLERYRRIDRDEFTSTLACLAGFVAFLDDVTEGEDVELGGLLFEREATWAVFEPGLPLPDGVLQTDDGHECRLLVARAVHFTVPCQGSAAFGPPINAAIFEDLAERAESQTRRTLPPSTRGAPSVLNFRGGVTPLDGQPPESRPTFRLRIRQRQGEAWLVHETDRYSAFLPSSFDLAQPFELEFELPPGQYTFYGPARIGAAAAR